ncbi:spore germination protein [Cytobacillus praedii]|uniref:spore germination protein n=1 Tax=Cytobacillus praedii TaxID=1742358 RepID=UPI002E240CEC|nr:spore germination protein [Cytobacillus praedii]
MPYLISQLYICIGNWKNQDGKKHESKSYQEAKNNSTGDLTFDLMFIKGKIGHNSDVKIREFNIWDTDIKAAIIFVEGLSDKELIEKFIMRSLMFEIYDEMKLNFLKGDSLNEIIKNRVLSISEVEKTQNLNNLISKVIKGSTALLIQGSSDIFILGTAKGKTRNIEEPISEALVRGPRVGFTEMLSDNTAILRQQGENESLSFKKFNVGNRGKKDLVVAYINDIANPSIVQAVIERINKIDLDFLPESGYVEQLIEDNFLSVFPQIQSTERPDRVISALFEGRVAILLDGTPFVLIVPVTFNMLLQSPEDYYERWIPGTLSRLLRFLAAFIALFVPSLYISFISFQPGLIPTKLAISIAGTRDGVPFPVLLEALIMEVSIEILREAGVRLPKAIGPAMGIVGGLIIGEAAVNAGIVSPIMVIVVALTAISSFTIPQYSAGITLRILRFVVMFCAAIFGLYGVILFFLLLCSHLVILKSFGVPYASPVVPYRLKDWKDFLVRVPLSMMKYRPKFMRTKDPIRKN